MILHVLSLHANVDSETHPVSYPMDTGSLFVRIKRPAHETNYSLSSSVEEKILASIRSL
jgi:hypothetical protein